MATCPSCGVSSRADPTALALERTFVVRPLGTFSVAGVQMKTVGHDALRLSCRCGWAILGAMDGDVFVGDPRTQEMPDAARRT